MEKVYPGEGLRRLLAEKRAAMVGLRMEADLGLHLIKDSRDGEGCLKESVTPFCCSRHENAGLEDRDGTEVSVPGGLTGNLPPGVGLGLPAWPVTGRSLSLGSPSHVEGSYLRCSSPPAPAGPPSHPPVTPGSVLECGWA